MLVEMWQVNGMLIDMLPARWNCKQDLRSQWSCRWNPGCVCWALWPCPRRLGSGCELFRSPWSNIAGKIDWHRQLSFDLSFRQWLKFKESFTQTIQWLCAAAGPVFPCPFFSEFFSKMMNTKHFCSSDAWSWQFKDGGQTQTPADIRIRWKSLFALCCYSAWMRQQTNSQISFMPCSSRCFNHDIPISLVGRFFFPQA